MEELIEANPLSEAKQRIVLAAGALFVEKGFKQTTVRDLASAVGIQSGSLFHHFDNKESILAAVMTRSIVMCTQRIEAVLTMQAQPLRQTLRGCVLAELEMVNGRTGEPMVLLVSEWQHLHALQAKALLTMRDAYEQRWLTLLGQAERTGHLRGTPFLVRKMLIGAIGWSRYWFCPEKNWSLSQLAENFVTIFWRESN